MKISISRPDLSDGERENVNNALSSTWISSDGEYSKTAENALAKITGMAYCALTSNGTSALHLALAALKIGPGDEVIVPSLTFISSVNVIKYVGATPIFVEIEKDSWGLDPSRVRQAINSKTRAIIAVHLYGKPSKIDELRNIADEKSLFLIEDNAEGLFGEYQNRPTGSWGHISTCSFFANKVITCGEGGAIATNDSEILERIKLLRGHGMDLKRKYYFPEVGFNYRLGNVSAAILSGQISRAAEMLAARRSLFEMYNDVVSQFGYSRFDLYSNNTVSAPWLYPLILESPEDARDCQDFLNSKEVETRPFFIPIHTLPPYTSLFSSQTFKDLSLTCELAAKGINLPTASNFNEQEIEYLRCSLTEVLKRIAAKQ